jgi:hypothetical protein
MLTHFSAQSRPWTLFRQKKGSDRKAEKGFRQDDRENLTVPKPDWVAFFPIYTRNFPRERIPTSKKWQLTKDPKNGMTENFSTDTLEHLARHGVPSNTAGLFRKPQDLKRMVLSDCICFPWLIVEHKKAGEMANEEKCHCQAANAGTAAVMMLEILSEIVPGDKKHMADEHIPPVITMTTVDKIVRVWITYCCKHERFGDDAVQYVSRSMFLLSGGICLLTHAVQKMDCIWKGDMTRVLDVIKLRAILENTHTWAMREQRPRISTYIDLWKYKQPMEPHEESGSGDEKSGSEDWDSWSEDEKSWSEDEESGSKDWESRSEDEESGSEDSESWSKSWTSWSDDEDSGSEDEESGSGNEESWSKSWTSRSDDEESGSGNEESWSKSWTSRSDDEESGSGDEGSWSKSWTSRSDDEESGSGDEGSCGKSWESRSDDEESESDDEPSPVRERCKRREGVSYSATRWQRR